MIYDLYFHNDFDGHATAAVMLAFFASRGDTIGHFVPVDHDMQNEWRDDHFFSKHRLFKGKRNAPVVVDFPYHPGTAFWFDHHPTAFKKESWQKSFKGDLSHAYEPSYASCCHMAVATLERNFGWHPPKHFAELCVWLDIIDGARYASAKQTILLKEPALQADAFLESIGRSPRESAWFIKALTKQSFDEIAKVPKVAAAARRARARANASLAFYKKHLVVQGRTTYIDLTRNAGKMLRYAPYYLFPNMRYSIRATMKGSLYHLGVGSNPWLKERGGIHIGKLLKQYGGGGHQGAGGCEFGTREESLRATREILAVLNKGKK